MRVTRQTKKPVQEQVNQKLKKKQEKQTKKKQTEKVSKPSINDLLKMCRPVKVHLVRDVYINSAEKIKSTFSKRMQLCFCCCLNTYSAFYFN